MSKSVAWGFDPAYYSQVNHVQRLFAQEVVEELKSLSFKSLLDIGCGDGSITAEIYGNMTDKHGVRVLGVDVDPQMVAFAEKNHNFADDIAHSSMTFALQDATALPHQDEFDMVVSFNCIHWIPNHADLWKSVHRAMKKGGQLKARFHGHNSFAELFQTVTKVSQEPEFRPHFEEFVSPFYFASQEELTSLLIDSSLFKGRTVVTRRVNKQTRDSLHHRLKSGWLPWMNRLPNDELKERFLSRLLETYQALVPLDAEGHYLIYNNLAHIDVEKI